MTVEWAFFILAAMLVASGGALAWGAALTRKRSYEEFIVNKSNRTKGDRP